MDAVNAQRDEQVLFEAVIVPHRSLSPRGQWVVTGVIATACMLTGLRFWLLGAWPVVGFIAVELGLAGGLLRLHARAARQSELLVLSSGMLRVVRTDANGRRSERQLRTAWLSVELEEREGRVPALLLCTRARLEEIATTLGEMEKRDLAEALRAALHSARNPSFDNPQLRD
jgi:uncharacterized membrane protein